MDTRPAIGTTVEVLLADARDWRQATVIEPHPKFTAPTQARVAIAGTGTTFDVWLANMRPHTPPAAPSVPPCMVCGVPSKWDTATGPACDDHCDELKAGA